MLKPGDAVPRVFSTQKPISAGEKFLGDKEKRILLTSNRAFTKQPNGNKIVYFSCFRSVSEQVYPSYF